jgi:hypothetical protein
MQGHNFAHRAAGRQNTTPQTTRPQNSQYVTPTEQQTRRPDVREFKSANRLTGLFTSKAERSVQAEAAWKASEIARRSAATRIQKEKIQDKADREANLAEERQRIAKELADKHAALRQQELSRKQRLRTAAINAQNEQLKKEAAERKAGFVPDRMWSRENWQGVVFGDNYHAFKNSQEKEADLGLSWEERMQRAFSEGIPREPEIIRKKSAKVNPFEGYNKHFEHAKTKAKARKRDFNEADPDDCWGFTSGPSFTQEGGNIWEWADAPPSEYPSGYGSPPPSSGYDYGLFEEGADEEEYNSVSGGYTTEYDDDDDEEGYGFFQGEEWENFKRSWGANSRQHHHEYYYTYENYYTNGGGGAGTGAQRQRTASVPVCQESAARAAQKAVDTARNNAPSTDENSGGHDGGNLGVLMLEIQTSVVSAAQYSGNDIAAFASALKIYVDHSKGQEYAKKMAKKGLLMTFHPDKLARAGVLEQYLGSCVTQLLLTSVK